MIRSVNLPLCLLLFHSRGGLPHLSPPTRASLCTQKQMCTVASLLGFNNVQRCVLSPDSLKGQTFLALCSLKANAEPNPEMMDHCAQSVTGLEKGCGL